MTKIIVIGAGTSGLFTAALLAKEGYKVVVYEKEKELGGRAKSISKDGYIVDYGVHLIRNGQKGFIPATLAKLGEKLDLTLLEDPEIVYYEDGKFNDFYREGYRLMKNDYSSVGYRRIIKSALEKGDAAIAGSMDKPVLRWLEEINASPTLKKFMALGAMGISCPFIERASAGEFFDFITRRIKLGNLKAGYPTGGFHVVHKKLSGIISSFGGEINAGKEVQKIRAADGKVKGVLVDDEEVDADAVVCAFPCQKLFEILDGKLVEPQRRDLMKNLVPVSGISVDYGLKKKITDMSSAILSAKDTSLIGLATSNVDSTVAPPGKQLMTFTALTSTEEVMDRARAQAVLSRLENAVSEMFPDKDGNVEWRRVLFLPFIDGVELNFAQHRGRRPGPETPGIEGLFLAGDTLCAAGAGGELAVTSAMLCVDKIVSHGTGQKHF
jgi:phytoene dehydrogenase-like protein